MIEQTSADRVGKVSNLLSRYSQLLRKIELIDSESMRKELSNAEKVVIQFESKELRHPTTLQLMPITTSKVNFLKEYVLDVYLEEITDIKEELLSLGVSAELIAKGL